MTRRPLRNFFREARSGMAAFCVVLFLTLQAMAAVPALHALVHSDANDPSHQCAVTLLLHGQVHSACATVQVVRDVPGFSAEPLCGSGVLVSTDVRLISCRGPPSSQSVS
ncbi:MAG TPA: hypothetical protein VGO67_16695 [Verrucomicrobiae bacterium]|jgi:predicted lysophospholipase L1 biosynthesis ABC-type transport system permease subunit